MARCLIVGCGCRGLTLATRLLADGHAVRGTTRRVERGAVLERAGVEPVVGDPGRVATLSPALEHVTVACLLLGSATGAPDALHALHGSRLEMLLTRMLDSPIRGIVYEAAGTVPDAMLARGQELIRNHCQDSLLSFVSLSIDPSDHPAWIAGARCAVQTVLAGGPG
ncbi:MAG: hypothetical protein ACYC91_02140 [Solirubrobacteraceae bacterium]